MTEIQKKLDEMGAKVLVNTKPDGSQELVVGLDLSSPDIPEELAGVAIFINTNPINTPALKNDPVYLWRAFPLTKVGGKFKKLSSDELPVRKDFVTCQIGKAKSVFMASPIASSQFPHIVGYMTLDAVRVVRLQIPALVADLYVPLESITIGNREEVLEAAEDTN